MFGEEGGLKKKKKAEEADLDITPMIDVTFLLLIFFMVTSTMQGTPDKDIPPAQQGVNENAAKFVNITVLAAASSSTDGEIHLEDTPVSLDQLKAELKQIVVQNRGRPDIVELMLFAERDVKSGFVGEVENVISEVATEEEVEIGMSFAVKDRK